MITFYDDGKEKSQSVQVCDDSEFFERVIPGFGYDIADSVEEYNENVRDYVTRLNEYYKLNYPLSKDTPMTPVDCFGKKV